MKLKNKFNIKGSRALITGAAGHLGRVICETLAELGADLILVDLSYSILKKQKLSLEKKWRVKVLSYPCDLESETERKNLITQIKKDKKTLNILINNAALVGTSNLPGWAVPFQKQRLPTWRRAMEVNLTSVFHLCQGLAPILGKKGCGVILNISSIYGGLGPDWEVYKGTNMANPAAYAASKGGLNQLTRWLATTLAPKIRVNAIAPGGIERNQPRKFKIQYKAKVPLARMATEMDFQGAVALLTTPASSYITGQIVNVDGGWSIKG